MEWFISFCSPRLLNTGLKSQFSASGNTEIRTGRPTEIVSGDSTPWFSRRAPYAYHVSSKIPPGTG